MRPNVVKPLCALSLAIASHATPAIAQTTQSAHATHEQCARPSVDLLGAQATYIGQTLPSFHADYSGPMSFVATGDHQLSQSYGLYGGVCVVRHLAVYVDGEM